MPQAPDWTSQRNYAVGEVPQTGLGRYSIKDRLRNRAAAYREQANTLDRLCAALPDDLPADVEDVLHKLV